MKLKHIFIVSLSTCLPGLSSCDLNITPDSYIPDSSFYKNEAEMNTAGHLPNCVRTIPA